MKTKTTNLLTLLLVIVVQFTFAQEKTISGNVTDQDGVPLPGVNIIVQGTTNGTQTGFDGEYTISGNVGQILLFTYVGQKNETRTIGTQSVINVQMQADAEALEEVVVTALGIKRDKKSLGYSQQTVSGENLSKTLETDVSNALAGKISGVQLVGAPSSGFKQAKIRLRGSSNVLYIVDNIKFSSLDGINTEDIDNISTLKGLAATALYGPEGRNGVVIITTKKAKSGDSKIILNTGITIDNVTNLMPTQNEYGGGYSQTWDTFNYNPATHPAEWASFDGQKVPNYAADESWGPRLDGTPVRHWDSWIPNDSEFGKLRPWSAQPNNIKNFFRTGSILRTSLTALKGGEDYSIKAQLTHTKKESIMPNSDRVTTQGAFDVSYNLTDKLKVFGNFNYQKRNTNNELDENYGNIFANINQWWQRQIDIDRVRDYKRNGNIYSWNMNGPSNPSPKYWDSPFFDVYENTNVNTLNTTFGKIGGTYDINNNLNATVEIRSHFTDYERSNRVGWGNKDNKAAYSEFERSRTKEEYFGIINYRKVFDNDFDVSASLGGEISHTSFKSLTAGSSGGLTTKDFYSLDTSVDKPNLTSFKSLRKNEATFIKASVGYKSTIYLDGSYRLDWSSTANKDNNLVSTLGVSSSFIFSKLIPQNNILSFGKLRVGYAEAPSFPGVYQLYQTYNTELSYGSLGAMAVPGAINNSNLEGGVKSEIEVGIETQFLNNRIGLDVSYYSKKDDNLPVRLSLDRATGNSSVFANSGKKSYKGLEITLSGTPIRTDNFTWETNLNFATVEVTVDELAEGIKNNYLAAYSFSPNYWGNESMINMQERVGEEYGAVYGRAFKKNEAGQYVLTSTGGYIKVENQYLGSYLPDFTGGLLNNFSYKNFNLSVGIDFQKGGKYFSMTDMFGKASGNHISTVGNNALGNPKRNPLVDASGTTSSDPINANNVGATSGGVLISGVDETSGNNVSYYKDLNADGWDKFAVGDEFLHDASYIKLRTLALNYNLPKTFTDKIGIEGAKFGVYANNLWLIYSEVDFIDPSELESPNSAGNNGFSFVEGGQAPSSRSIGFNLQLTF